MRRLKYHQNEGFTLIELLIAVTISAIIFLTSSALTFALFSSNTQITRQDVLEQAKNDVQSELSGAIKWAQSITISDNGNTLTIQKADGSTDVYKRTVNNTLTKNDVPLTSAVILVKSMTIDDYSQNGQVNEKSVVITIELENKQFNAIKDTVRIVVSQRYGTAETTF